MVIVQEIFREHITTPTEKSVFKLTLHIITILQRIVILTYILGEQPVEEYKLIYGI